MFSIATTVLFLCAAQDVADDSVNGVSYEPLETRGATLIRMNTLLNPEQVSWGDWYQCSPFPYTGHGDNDLASAHAPELELEKMARGVGPDLSATYEGKNGTQAGWTLLGPMANRRIDMHRSEDPELSDLVAGYLYTTIDSPAPQSVHYTFGSDDGCRLWLNGALLFEKDVPRGLNPREDEISLDLQQGINHLLVEVADGFGGWEFQILTKKPLGPTLEAKLNYLLDRDFPPTPMHAHYTAYTIPIPEGLVIEVGGMTVLPAGQPAIATRRGDVYLVDGAYATPPLNPSFELFAEGLHEPLGLEWREEEGQTALYTVQRGELTRLVDLDGDRRADRYEAFCDDWGVSGNYHEFAFGPKFDDEGNAWVTLNVGFCGSLGKSIVPWRGWALKITPAGELIPVCTGLRSPNGIGKWKDGEMFYVDNQGDYIATNRLSHLEQDSWHGHPAGLRWRDDMQSADSPPPPRKRASIWFPYKRMGQSTADIVLDTSGGAFGPFSEQFFVGDQMNASVIRVDMEKINGHYQGACFPFIDHLDSGVNRLAFAPDGSMFVGQTDRGWGSVGERSYGLQRIVWNGNVPFEVLHMTVHASGFDLEFTQDVDTASALDSASYKMASFTYEYHADYGAPEADRREVLVTGVKLLGPNKVRLQLSEMRLDSVQELTVTGVRSKTGATLVNPEAYYTLMELPN
ncbi:MAG: hypothetical protein ACI9F9_001910 [Candidatus Paceibacteria bacterium]|jgi:hypothetical protein